MKSSHKPAFVGKIIGALEVWPKALEAHLEKETAKIRSDYGYPRFSRRLV